MTKNHKYYEVIEQREDGTISTYILTKENAERLYRTIRARGNKKVKGL